MADGGITAGATADATGTNSIGGMDTDNGMAIPALMAGPDGWAALMKARGAEAETANNTIIHRYNYEEDVNNANLARENAAENERRARVIGAKVIGQNQAAIGASGLQSGGSAMDAISNNAANAELQALTIRHKGEVAAIGYENQGNMELYKIRAGIQEGEMKREGAYIEGASNLGNHAAQIAGAGG